MQFLKQSTAADVVLGPFVDDTDGKTTEEALTLAQADLQLTKNGGSAAQKNDATSATHLYGGNYKVPLNTTDTGTLGCLTLMCKESGALPVVAHFMVVTANWYDSMCSTDKLDVNVEEWNATAVPSEHTAGYPIVTVKDGTGTGEINTTSGRVDADITHIATAAVSTTTAQLGVNLVNIAGSAVSTSSAQIGVNAVQVGGGTVANGSIPNAVAGAAGGVFIAGTNAATTITSAGGAALTLSSTGSNGSALVATGNGSGHGIIATGGATGDGLRALGGATSGDGIHTEAQASGDGCHFIGAGNGNGFLAVGAGTGDGAHWTGGATGHGMHAEGGGTNAHGALFQRGGAGGDDMAFQNNDVTIATVSSVTAIATGGIAAASFAAGAIDAAAIANGAIDSATFASGAIDAAAIAANAIDAATFAADVDAEIAAMVWNAATATYGSAGSYGEKVEALNTGAVTVSSIGNDVITAASIAADAGTEIGTAVWATTTRQLTSSQTFNLTGDITGNLSGSVGSVTGAVGSVTGAVGSVTGAVGSVTGNVGGNVTGSVGSLATQAKADVNAEVLDVISTDTVAEPGAVPAANAPLDEKVSWLYMLSRNKVTQTATAQKVYADDGSTEEASAAVSDNGTTFERGEWTTT